MQVPDAIRTIADGVTHFHLKPSPMPGNCADDRSSAYCDGPGGATANCVANLDRCLAFRRARLGEPRLPHLTRRLPPASRVSVTLCPRFSSRRRSELHSCLSSHRGGQLRIVAKEVGHFGGGVGESRFEAVDMQCLFRARQRLVSQGLRGSALRCTSETPRCASYPRTSVLHVSGAHSRQDRETGRQ